MWRLARQAQQSWSILGLGLGLGRARLGSSRFLRKSRLFGKLHSLRNKRVVTWRSGTGIGQPCQQHNRRRGSSEQKAGLLELDHGDEAALSERKRLAQAQAARPVVPPGENALPEGQCPPPDRGEIQSA